MSEMLDALHRAIVNLPDLCDDLSLWDSLLINRRKPYTYRVWTMLPTGERLSLHKFDPCDDREAFDHPHPWPGAFMIMQGAYDMRVGFSPDRVSPQSEVASFVLREHSGYEITNPLTWHAVIPRTTTYTIMLNGKPFAEDVAHVDVRTTKGKDLDKMPASELVGHIAFFKHLALNYRARVPARKVVQWLAS